MRSWNVTWWLVAAALAAILAQVIAAGDFYRTVWAVAVCAAWLGLRRDFVGGLR